jgi:hypothetical protein
MAPESPPESALYRVTFFFGPEPTEGASGVQACVFNVKKRSWKSGIQVAVEIDSDQLSSLRRTIRLDGRFTDTLMKVAPDERLAYQARVTDLFTQAVSWCKLDLCLSTGLKQENQRIPANELVTELDRAVPARREYVVAYISTELDLAHDDPSHSSL